MAMPKNPEIQSLLISKVSAVLTGIILALSLFVGRTVWENSQLLIAFQANQEHNTKTIARLVKQLDERAVPIGKISTIERDLDRFEERLRLLERGSAAR